MKTLTLASLIAVPAVVAGALALNTFAPEAPAPVSAPVVMEEIVVTATAPVVMEEIVVRAPAPVG